MAVAFKKMAGTSAVFVIENYKAASPVERDGLVWQGDELHLDEIPDNLTPKPTMANALALEGLEDYDPASNGDMREVTSLDASFVYLERLRGWVQLP
jgi:hypothetical protein